MKYLLTGFLILNIYSCIEAPQNSKLYSLNNDTLFFNTIKQSDTFQQTIFCINNSDRKIKILNIEPGCGCTKTYLKDTVINVKDSIPIFIKYIPALTKDSGSVMKYITIRTNSTPSFLNLVIKGAVTK